MYAVIETGGKQHKVEKGMVLSIDLLKEDLGKKITFDNVLLFVDGEKVEVGQPYLSNVKVTAEIKDVVKSDFQEAGDEDVFRKLKDDLEGIVAEQDIRAKMNECLQSAKDRVSNG